MKTIIIISTPEGPKLSYYPEVGHLHFQDLNPVLDRVWVLTPKELRHIAWGLFKASFMRRTK